MSARPTPPLAPPRYPCAPSAARRLERLLPIATFERSARVPHVTRAQESLRQSSTVYSPEASRRKLRAFRPNRGCKRQMANSDNRYKNVAGP